MPVCTAEPSPCLPLCRRSAVPSVRCAVGPMARRSAVPSVRCADGPLCRRSAVPPRCTTDRRAIGSTIQRAIGSTIQRAIGSTRRRQMGQISRFDGCARAFRRLGGRFGLQIVTKTAQKVTIYQLIDYKAITNKSLIVNTLRAKNASKAPKIAVFYAFIHPKIRRVTP